MTDPFVTSHQIQDWPRWENRISSGGLLSFELELTARCNLNCRHCYINLPSDDPSRERELSYSEIREIADEAVRMGAMWCSITGGEPLLRPDFPEIYQYLKTKGLLVNVLTNGLLIRERHIRLFKEFPPRDLEITVYGASQAVYDRVTRTKGAFSAFRKGLNRLLQAGVKVRLKAMAIQSNFSEFEEISQFCKQMTHDYFRFDPFLHGRIDRNSIRNKEIADERLTPQQVVKLERSQQERFEGLQKNCDKLISQDKERTSTNQFVFSCATGIGRFTVSHDGYFLLCSSLRHPDCVYDLRKGSLQDAFNRFTRQVRAMKSDNTAFLNKCKICPLFNLCLWCPAHAYLETGRLDEPVDFFCQIAQERAKMLTEN